MVLRAGFHGTVGQPSAQVIDGSLKFDDGSSQYLNNIWSFLISEAIIFSDPKYLPSPCAIGILRVLFAILFVNNESPFNFFFGILLIL